MFAADFRRWQGAGELKVFPPGRGDSMSKDEERLPVDKSDKKEEQGQTLAKFLDLAPLLALILQALELILKLLGVIK